MRTEVFEVVWKVGIAAITTLTFKKLGFLFGLRKQDLNLGLRILKLAVLSIL